MNTVGLLAPSENWDHMNGWGGGWMWLWGVAMMAAFVALIVWIARSSSAHQSRERHDPTVHARAILAERFARGELTTEEYRERVSELS